MFDRHHSVDDPADLLRRHGDRLRSLVGSEIVAFWTAWDDDAQDWFRDEAVVIQLGSINLEIVCWKLSDIMLSWSQIDLLSRPSWVADWDASFHLSWRADCLPELAALVGQTVTSVSIVEYLHKTRVVRDPKTPSNVGTRHEAWLLHGIELGMHAGGVCFVFNDLDQNGISAESPDDEYFRRIRVR